MAVVTENPKAARSTVASGLNPALRRPTGLHVCMIAYTFYPFDARVRREAETLAAHGYHVRCLTTKTAALSPRRFVLQNVEVRELRVGKYRGKSQFAYALSYLFFLVAATLACLRLMAKGELDIVHAHNLPDFLVFAGLIPRVCGRKVVLDIHDSIPETFSTKFSGPTLLWKALCFEESISARVAHRIICVNEPQRRALVARGIPEAKTFVSMNVPDPRIFGRPALDAGMGRTAGTFKLVYHGTMAERLGVDLVIRAVARLAHSIPSIRLHLWGDGDDLPRFRSLARELGVDDHVEFRPDGYPLEELPSRLRVMDVGVVGNRRNAATELMLPVKMMEYAALGIPAVVPRLRTIEHYFSDGMAAFYQPEDVESLSSALFELYSDLDRRSRQAARAKVFLAKYGWDQQGPELAGFYDELMESTRQ
jgi:glycosyltransferase involved in cell wall biosynthesis